MTPITLLFVLSCFYDLSPASRPHPLLRHAGFLLIFLGWHSKLHRWKRIVGRAGRIFIPRSIHLGYTDISPWGRLRKDNNYRPSVPGESWAAAIKRVCRTSRRREDSGDEKGASGAQREEPGARRQHLPNRGPHGHRGRDTRIDPSEPIPPPFVSDLLRSRFCVQPECSHYCDSKLSLLMALYNQ